MRVTRQSWLFDPIVLGLALVGVLVGSYAGATSHERDIDEMVYRSVLFHMQDGETYYEASRLAIIEKDGVGPSQVRSLRTPVVAVLLAPFPEATWRWLAMVPALALCASAAALAGPDLIARRAAAGLGALWMIVSLPLLYLHQELWGAALMAFGGLQMREGRDRRAAVLCLLATAVRELFGISLLLGLILGRDRRPWLAALVTVGIGAVVHAHWAQGVLDPAGYDPPLRAVEPYLTYLSPGNGLGGASRSLGAVLLIAAAVGFWQRRHLRDQQLLGACAGILVIATAMSGRAYWVLTWCALTSAAAAIAGASGVRRLRGVGSGAP